MPSFLPTCTQNDQLVPNQTLIRCCHRSYPDRASCGLSLAWLLARKRFPGRNVVDAIVTLPLVLPPTVLGYYLLVLLGTRSAVGGFLYRTMGIRLTFTVTAAIIAATIHALRW